MHLRSAREETIEDKAVAKKNIFSLCQDEVFLILCYLPTTEAALLALVCKFFKAGVNYPRLWKYKLQLHFPDDYFKAKLRLETHYKKIYALTYTEYFKVFRRGSPQKGVFEYLWEAKKPIQAGFSIPLSPNYTGCFGMGYRIHLQSLIDDSATLVEEISELKATMVLRKHSRIEDVKPVLKYAFDNENKLIDNKDNTQTLVPNNLFQDKLKIEYIRNKKSPVAKFFHKDKLLTESFAKQFFDDYYLLAAAKKAKNQQLLDSIFFWIIVFSKQESFRMQRINQEATHYHRTMLDWAIDCHQPVSVIKQLIFKGARITNDFPMSYLYSSAEASNLELVNYFISLNINIELDDLIGAARGGSVLIFETIRKKLIANGVIVDINASLFSGSMLHAAVENGHTEMVQHLLEFEDINIDKQNSLNKTVLRVAADLGYTKIFKLLFEKKFSMCKTQSDKKVLALLLNNNQLELNSSDNNGILKSLAGNGYVELISYINEKYTLLTDGEVLPLMDVLKIVMKQGYVNAFEAIVELLKRQGSYPVSFDLHLYNLLQFAYENRNIDLVRTLLKMGAGTNTLQARKIIYLAAEKNDTETLQMVFGRFFAILNNNKIITDLCYDSAFFASIYNAIKDSNFNLTKTLLEAVLSSIEKPKDQLAYITQKFGEKKQTLLHTAASVGSFEIVKYLASFPGNNINEKQADGNTPLHNVVYFQCENKETSQSRLDIISFLCSCPTIEINQKNKIGMTALLIAAHKGDLLIVKLLLKYNADLKISNGIGQTVLDYLTDPFLINYKSTPENTLFIDMLLKSVPDFIKKRQSFVPFSFLSKPIEKLKDSEEEMSDDKVKENSRKRKNDDPHEAGQAEKQPKSLSFS